MNTLSETLSHIRAMYVDKFLREVDRIRVLGASLILEPVLRDKLGEPIREGTLLTPMRSDIYAPQNGRMISIDSDQMLKFETILLSWNAALRVNILPFCWDACPVEIVGRNRSVGFGPVQSWFEKWIDRDDTREAGRFGLRNAIHFISDPDDRDGTTHFQVDFGSAPIDAFEEMLNSFAACGALEIAVGAD